MFILILCVLGLVMLGMSISIVSSKKKKKSMDTSNEKFDKYIYDNDITVTKFVDIPTFTGSSKFIIDENNNYVYYLITNNENNLVDCKKISFKDVLKCELIKDSKIKMVEDKFSIFDNFNQKEYVKKFGLRITFNDLSFTHLDILFLNSIQGQTLFGLNHVIENTNNWIQIMNIVIERGKQLNSNK